MGVTWEQHIQQYNSEHETNSFPRTDIYHAGPEVYLDFNSTFSWTKDGEHSKIL